MRTLIHAAALGFLLAAACAWDRIPRSASGKACEDAVECRAIICTCGDGNVVRHRGCVNGNCQEPGDWCARACEDLGGWTPRDAGLTLCNANEDCPAVDCRCVDGTVQPASTCLPDGTCGEASWGCWEPCAEHGGWADCAPEGSTCEPFSGACCQPSFCDEGGTCTAGRW